MWKQPEKPPRDCKTIGFLLAPSSWEPETYNPEGKQDKQGWQKSPTSQELSPLYFLSQIIFSSSIQSIEQVCHCVSE